MSRAHNPLSAVTASWKGRMVCLLQRPLGVRLSFEADHRQSATHGRGVGTPLFVVSHGAREHGVALGAGDLSGSHGDKSTPDVHDGVRPGLEVAPPRWLTVLAEVGGEDDEGITVGHVGQGDTVDAPGIPAYRLKHEAPQAHGQMLGPPVGSHEQARVQFAEGSIEALATRGESHLCHATRDRIAGFGWCRRRR